MKEQLDRLEIKPDKLSGKVGNHLVSAEKNEYLSSKPYKKRLSVCWMNRNG